MHNRPYYFSLLALALSVYLPHPAMASVTALANQYPPGSIQSAVQASAALEAVEKEKQSAQAEHLALQKACYEKFLVTPCLEEERSRHQDVSAVLNAISLEASRYQRQLKVHQTEQRRRDAEEERLRQGPQQAVQRQQSLEAYARKQADGLKKQQEQQQKSEQVVAKPPAQPKAARNDLAQRQKSAAEYSKKNQEAAERRAQTAKRRAENQADRARKAAARPGGGKPVPAAASAPVPGPAPAKTSP